MKHSQIHSLQTQHRQLVARLKLENPAVYHWFVQRGIQFNKLGKYTANISAAIALASAPSPALPSSPNIPPAALAASTQIRPEELKGLSDLERANLVWSRYGSLIRLTAKKYSLDPNLIFATIMVESGGNTYAVRQEPRLHDASYGLGQLLYSTAKGLGYTGAPRGLYDPAVNIDLIGKYHRRNADRYAHLSNQELVTAYNTGSPYKTPLPGHLSKFNKWYNSPANLQTDLT